MSGVRPRDNPFRSEQIDALSYRPQSDTLDTVWQRLVEAKYRGAILGPHGHGKSTLMRQLQQRLDASHGRPVRFVQVMAGGTNVKEVAAHVSEEEGLLLIDGYDLMPWTLRWLARQREQVLVTSHERVWLPTLTRCATSPALLSALIHELSPAWAEALGEAGVAALYGQHDGNLRDALRALYDRAAMDGFPES